jgi:DNA-binding MarR family transcriptional regulator
MKSLIHNLDKAFENRIRLGVMSILVLNDWVEFNELKKLLEVTDGNLASHISALDKKGFIETRKKFVGKKPNTSFKVTENGRSAFQQHIRALEELLKNSSA